MFLVNIHSSFSVWQGRGSPSKEGRSIFIDLYVPGNALIVQGASKHMLSRRGLPVLAGGLAPCGSYVNSPYTYPVFHGVTEPFGLAAFLVFVHPCQEHAPYAGHSLPPAYRACLDQQIHDGRLPFAYPESLAPDSLTMKGDWRAGILPAGAEAVILSVCNFFRLRTHDRTFGGSSIARSLWFVMNSSR